MHSYSTDTTYLASRRRIYAVDPAIWLVFRSGCLSESHMSIFRDPDSDSGTGRHSKLTEIAGSQLQTNAVKARLVVPIALLRIPFCARGEYLSANVRAFRSKEHVQ